MTTTSLSLPPLAFPSISGPKLRNSLTALNLSLPCTSAISLSPSPSPRKLLIYVDSQSRRNPLKSSQIWEISAASEDVSTTVENTQDIVSSTGDDGVSTIISVLLFVAFVALSILTIGVVYIAVSDFLQKREKEKFEKEEAAKKKKGGKKGNVKARAGGPRGFGQKIEEYDD